jgi:hypothetical protein
MRIYLSLLCLCAFYAVAGCQTNFGESTSTIQATPTSTEDVEIPIVTIDPSLSLGLIPTAYPGVAPLLEPVPAEILVLVTNDLTEKTGAALEHIHVLETEAVEWPDSSLGCGEPGEIYLPVVTPGFRIVLEVDGQLYSYHTNTTNRFILCEMPGPIMISPTPSR